jgi:hypothetical protein
MPSNQPQQQHQNDDARFAPESGEPQLQGNQPEARAQEPLKKHGDKLDPTPEHPESGRHRAVPKQ